MLVLQLTTMYLAQTLRRDYGKELVKLDLMLSRSELQTLWDEVVMWALFTLADFFPEDELWNFLPHIRWLL